MKTPNRLYQSGQSLLAAAFGASATLAFSPFSYWPLMLVALWGLFTLLQNASPKRSAWLGFCWGLGQFTTGVSWVYVSIDHFGGMPAIAGLSLMALLIAYLSLYPALFGALVNKLPSRQPGIKWLILAPALWLVIDWLRGWVFTGFPWLWPGYSQIDSPLAGIAPVLGVQGITLVLAILAGLLVLITPRWGQWQGQARYGAVAIGLGLIAVSYGLGTIQWVTKTDQQQQISLIQGNVPQALKWRPDQRWPTLMKYLDLTRQHWDSDVIIWPEAAVPALERELPRFFSQLDQAAKHNQTTVITGALDQNEQGAYFNNVLALGAGTPEYRYPAPTQYSKHHLLPFGEFVPFEGLLRPLAPLFNLPMSSFSPGEPVQPALPANGWDYITALCYEIAFPAQIRDNLNADSDAIITLSNDAWFGRSIGPWQHLEIARMRALEFGLPVIRATNNGVTALVDEHGKLEATLPQFETQVLTTQITGTEGITPYRQWGNTPLWLWVMTSGCLGVMVWRRDTRKPSKISTNL
ncbi:apolipoprotein N-acyltransferase [Salinivibrio kushneri]|uniref:apolipoprotein N-acyltransferase n=1 Tax=Salinivibrio kushneri TaxID=1908198 RepID=UPI0022B3CCBE|nr:apolipoprotein N-acyltransferase [Salinivibrio kushneri]WBA12371.1 apolipoprotein N-acyltransferase [Salinivibrio kushneri]